MSLEDKLQFSFSCYWVNDWPVHRNKQQRMEETGKIKEEWKSDRGKRWEEGCQKEQRQKGQPFPLVEKEPEERYFPWQYHYLYGERYVRWQLHDRKTGCHLKRSSIILGCNQLIQPANNRKKQFSSQYQQYQPAIIRKIPFFTLHWSIKWQLHDQKIGCHLKRSSINPGSNQLNSIG